MKYAYLMYKDHEFILNLFDTRSGRPVKLTSLDMATEEEAREFCRDHGYIFIEA